MTTTVLSVATRAVLDACAQVGLDPDAIAVASGLAREQLADPDARIAADLADAVWRHAYEVSGSPDLALLAAEALPFGAYKVIDFVVANAATVGEGLLRVARYFPIIDPRGAIETDAASDPIAVRMTVPAGEVPRPPSSTPLPPSLPAVAPAVGRLGHSQPSSSPSPPPATRPSTTGSSAARFASAHRRPGSSFRVPVGTFGSPGPTRPSFRFSKTTPNACSPSSPTANPALSSPFAPSSALAFAAATSPSPPSPRPWP